MAIFYAVPDAVGNAASMDNISAGSVTADVGINGLSTPLQKLGSAFTGNIPKIGVSIAAAAGGLSWALGTESQITKYALRCAAGGGIAMAAPAAVNSLTGCLM
jgi:type IV secretory pathway VirB2 component (pilin)